MSEDGDLAPPIADLEIVSTRVFDFPRDLIFRAWTDPAHLAHWWGPKGFTNSFHEFDLRAGGNWRFVMHGPDGVDYKNHSVFVEIAAPERIVFDHVSGPYFRVAATFDAVSDEQTRVTFRMLFETPAVCAQVKTFAVKANEENFDRLQKELKRMA
ncbi:SRPBCC family protein [Paraburkholderia diazotrophica]|uniref:Activator of Hsp90 ATPase homolog 1-like protein n=1 Tax=Paraburkholderia diazotrophica TaxID=667676 RepID=A0A1H6SAE7_9BURK|nr:SRPBCC family protein [Paraburkholderia diazotrophica]SEI64839.1 Activator of Hsp90 ATPase homolog 1-like protein [Paraburkholderia diazotrophica]